MPSYVTYTGYGSTTDFAVPFPYIARSHVTAKVNDVTTSFTWVTSSVIRITPAPASGVSVYVSRNTPLSVPLVLWQDAANLKAADLVLDTQQTLYASEEGRDYIDQQVVALTTQVNQAIIGGYGVPSVGAPQVGRLLRATAVGVYSWVDAASARLGIGATTIGSALITAATQGDARAALGVNTTGSLLMSATDAASARTTLGFTATGSSLVQAADAAAGRGVLLAPPLPTASAGFGQWLVIQAALGAALVLPAGGTWGWFAIQFNATGNITSYASNVTAGGSTLAAAVAGQAWCGFAWRIA
jgi:hypothetical protein